MIPNSMHAVPITTYLVSYNQHLSSKSCPNHLLFGQCSSRLGSLRIEFSKVHHRHIGRSLMKRKINSSNGSKGATAVVEAVAAPAQEKKRIVDDAEIRKQLEDSINAAMNLSHAEISKRVVVFNKVREKKIAAADRHRKLQIRNINELYEYEVQETEAIFQKSVKDIQDKLIIELKAEAERILSSMKPDNLNTSHENDTDDNNNNRLLRSNAPLLDADTIGLEKSKEKGAIRRRTNNTPSSLSLIQKNLPEQVIREDFLHIVKDIETRAASYYATVQKNINQLNPAVTINVDQLQVGTEIYTIGDLVIIFSHLTQESLTGVVTTITCNEIIIRSGAGLGTRFAFHISLLRNGRITIARDVDAKDHVDMMKNVAKIKSNSS